MALISETVLMQSNILCPQRSIISLNSGKSEGIVLTGSKVLSPAGLSPTLQKYLHFLSAEGGCEVIGLFLESNFDMISEASFAISINSGVAPV